MNPRKIHQNFLSALLLLSIGCSVHKKDDLVSFLFPKAISFEDITIHQLDGYLKSNKVDTIYIDEKENISIRSKDNKFFRINYPINKFFNFTKFDSWARSCSQGNKFTLIRTFKSDRKMHWDEFIDYVKTGKVINIYVKDNYWQFDTFIDSYTTVRPDGNMSTKNDIQKLAPNTFLPTPTY